MFINYSDLPGFSNIYLDYLYEFDNVKQFYPWNFRDLNSYKTVFDKIISAGYTKRQKLSDIISAQYEHLDISKQTERNINLLSKDNTLAIVTGQQLGIFGGPLYTIYKTITAIKLATSLKENFDGYNFVPVFWLEGDDHDFDEVRWTSFIGNDNSVKTLRYDDGLPMEMNRGGVGKMIFNEDIDFMLNEINDLLRDNDFKQDLMNLLAGSYEQGKTFKESFRDLLLSLFDEHGLVILDPYDAEVKKLLKPLFGKELEQYSDHTVKVLQRTAELEELYHAQVKVKPINLFLETDDGRHLIEPADDGMYRLKGKRTKISLENLLDQLEEDPMKFSPNVLLRPICQDYLLPTAAYVAGPGEISYFAQVNPLYEMYDVVPPVIYPRASAAILENQNKAIADKYDLSVQDFYLDEQILTSKVIGKLSDSVLKSKFEEAHSSIQETLDNLRVELEKVDKQLIDLTDKTGQRMFQSLDNLRGKADKFQERRYETAIRQIDKVRTSLFPNGNHQERELSLIYFFHKYGPDILKFIFDELKINKFEHQIIEL